MSVPKRLTIQFVRTLKSGIIPGLEPDADETPGLARGFFCRL